MFHFSLIRFDLALGGALVILIACISFSYYIAVGIVGALLGTFSAMQMIYSKLEREG